MRKFLLAALLSIAHILSSPISASSTNSYQEEVDRIADEVATKVSRANLKSVAVLDFTDLQGNVQEVGRLIAEELTTSLVLKDRQFRTIDRTNLRSILVENSLSTTGVIDPKDVKKLKVAGVGGLIRGTLVQTENSISLTIQVISSETAEIVGGARGEISKTYLPNSLGNVVLGPKESLPANLLEQGHPMIQDKNLKIIISLFRKDMEGRIKSIFVIRNISTKELELQWLYPQLIDDQGGQWEADQIEGIAATPLSISKLPPNEELSALVIFKQKNGTSKGTRFNLIGPIDVRSGGRDWTFFPNLRNVPLP